VRDLTVRQINNKISKCVEILVAGNSKKLLPQKILGGGGAV